MSKNNNYESLRKEKHNMGNEIKEYEVKVSQETRQRIDEIIEDSRKAFESVRERYEKFESFKKKDNSNYILK